MEEFLKELSELSEKHGIYIGARHDDWWYAPMLINLKTDIIIASSLCYYEDGYDADKEEEEWETFR